MWCRPVGTPRSAFTTDVNPQTQQLVNGSARRPRVSGVSHPSHSRTCAWPSTAERPSTCALFASGTSQQGSVSDCSHLLGAGASAFHSPASPEPFRNSRSGTTDAPGSSDPDRALASHAQPVGRPRRWSARPGRSRLQFIKYAPAEFRSRGECHAWPKLPGGADGAAVPGYAVRGGTRHHHARRQGGGADHLGSRRSIPGCADARRLHLRSPEATELAATLRITGCRDGGGRLLRDARYRVRHGDSLSGASAQRCYRRTPE